MSETTEEKIEGVLLDVKLVGFAAVKEIAAIKKQTSGTMPCPLCGQPLKFSIASNGHLAVSCAREECLRAME